MHEHLGRATRGPGKQRRFGAPAIAVCVIAVAVVLGAGAWGAAASAAGGDDGGDCTTYCPPPTTTPSGTASPLLTDALHPFPTATRRMRTSTRTTSQWWEPRAFHGDVYVIGDSITRGATAQLHRLHPRWQVNGVPGRRVYTLPTVLQYRLDHGPRPKTVVIALGTNAAPTWTKADYVRVTRMLPASTDIVFVSTYRNARLWPATLPYYERSPLQSYYSSWMTEIAGARPHTCVVHWRHWASTHRHLLRDGTHPLTPGKKAWAKLVSRGVLACS